jgi:hypothetical protein
VVAAAHRGLHQEAQPAILVVLVAAVVVQMLVLELLLEAQELQVKDLLAVDLQSLAAPPQMLAVAAVEPELLVLIVQAVLAELVVQD